ncbi:MAG: ATP-binding protein [Acidimicrobiales bacterium]
MDVPRSDLLIDMVEAEHRGDRQRFRAVVEAVISEERAKQHHLVADRLTEIVSTSGVSMSATRNGYRGSDLLLEIVPQRCLDGLVLASGIERETRQVIEEHHRADVLRAHNLEPRHRIVLQGPPGNGKTTLAEAIAAEVMVPLLVVRYEAVVSSFLGETAARLDALFDHVRTRRCVLFFDEFDTLGKERADEHETGEVKRVVSSLLLQIDRLPSHVIVVAATNHGELIDRAAWRRFQVRLELATPSRAQIEAFVGSLERRLGGGFGLAPRTMADRLRGASYSDVEQLCLDVRRRYVLDLPDADLRAITSERLKSWQPQTPR